MTIRVGVNTVLMGAVMLADTRLSNPGPQGQILLRDACPEDGHRDTVEHRCCRRRALSARYLFADEPYLAMARSL